MLEYMRPAIVGQAALITLLKKLEKHKGKEMVININGGALYEIRGTSATKKCGCY